MKFRRPPPIILSSSAAAAALLAASSVTTILPSATSFSSGGSFVPITHRRLRTACSSATTPPSRHARPVLRMALNDDENGGAMTNGVNGSSSSSTATMEHEKEEASTRFSSASASSSWSIGSPSRKVSEEDRKKRVARQALTKLLARQQHDVQQTLDLIANLELEDCDTNNERYLFDEEDYDSDNAAAIRLPPPPTSIAASIAAGADYGYISRSEGCRVPYNNNNMLKEIDQRFQNYGPPSNILSLGSQQFMRNLRAMFNEYRDETDNPALTPRQIDLQEQLSTLTLNSTAIWERERSRGELVAPLIIKIPYLVLCYLLDVIFEGRNPFQRFFLLETVARMPYFSYITMLHLYETLGFWRRSADIKRIHFAEEWNEFHHLLIMESLGGDQPYYVRFMAQHSALAYYLVLCLLWMCSPSLSYKFSEMLETHAVDTYGQFVDENESKLKELPPSLVAVEYYTLGVSDPMFGEYQTSGSVDKPPPGLNMKSLYDVFCAIRTDEGTHVRTMQECLDPNAPTLSQGLENRVLTGVALAAAASYLFGNYPGFDSLNGIFDGLATVTGGGGADVVVDGLTETMTSDLDQVLADTSSDAPTIINGIVGGLAGLANGLNEMGSKLGMETDAVEVDEDVITDATGSALEGFELDAMMDALRGVIAAILELTPFV